VRYINMLLKRDPDMHQTKKGGNNWYFGMSRGIPFGQDPYWCGCRLWFGSYRKGRYVGLAKNTAQIQTLFALSNLWMARRHLMKTV
jgi:IS5 family transposase